MHLNEFFSISSRGSLFFSFFYQDQMGHSGPVIVFSFSRCSWWLSLVSFPSQVPDRCRSRSSMRNTLINTVGSLGFTFLQTALSCFHSNGTLEAIFHWSKPSQPRSLVPSKEGGGPVNNPQSGGDTIPTANPIPSHTSPLTTKSVTKQHFLKLPNEYRNTTGLFNEKKRGNKKEFSYLQPCHQERVWRLLGTLRPAMPTLPAMHLLWLAF